MPNRGCFDFLQEVSIFVFEKKTAEKLHKPKRKETVAEILRGSVRQLERFRHPKILQVYLLTLFISSLLPYSFPYLGEIYIS